MATFLACPGLGHADRRLPSPRRARDKDASTLHFRRRKEERYRQPQPDACGVADASRSDPPRRRSGVLSACAGAAANGTFFRNALDNRERLIRTPSRASISARSRAIVQFFLSATGSSSNGVTTRNATVLFTGSGPGAMRAFNASTPPLVKSPRQRRTVSSRTPKASAMRELVRPVNVNRTARALSASPRSRDVARADKAARCSPFAVTGDFPLTPHLSDSMRAANRSAVCWSTYRNRLRWQKTPSLSRTSRQRIGPTFIEPT